MADPPVIVLTGVAGSGKSTVGRLVAALLRWPYVDGDDLHPPANVAKMSAGQPLDEDDRRPWLAAVGAWLDARGAAAEPGVLSCSALRRAHRSALAEGRPAVRLVLLDGPPEVIAERLATRRGHFLPPALLPSQLAAAERPGPDEDVLTVDVRPPAPAVAEAVLSGLGLRVTP
ncbi:gluconokinase [Pilimelia anulata]|uniref:Gluconokinase n=1 Tax=Pilimelia anulata TaxID=53371 RepID=A0A8J3F9J8_9ACTN|nr:gluconokinase [Pilimelia anulata]GGJ87304.1 gluconokinase [Pilimelia anulata]